MVTRADVDQYRAALDQAVDLAQTEFVNAYAAVSGVPPETMRDGLIEVFEVVADKYGNLSGAASAEFYEGIRARSVPGKSFRAVAAPTISQAHAEGKVRFAAKHLWTSSPEKTLDLLLGELQKAVENTARETILLNARRDPRKPRWARVPGGGKTCAWCLMLASRGWVYATAETARGENGETYHRGDRCMAVPAWGRSPRLPGYDPEEMFRSYEAARREVEADGMPETSQVIAQRLRDMFPDRFTDGAEVPSILRDGDAGWPASSVNSVSPGRWRHILKRHGHGGQAIDTFSANRSAYDIAKIIRSVVSHPDFSKPHPGMEGFILNYFKRVDEQLVVVGTKVSGNGKLSVRTAFPPSEGTGIL